MAAVSELLAEAIDETFRFLKAAKAAKARLKAEGEYASGCKETAAAKRASMDLSRSLSRLRAGPYA